MSMIKRTYLIFFYFFLSGILFTAILPDFLYGAAAKTTAQSTPAYYGPYLKLLSDVYDTMDQHYYQPVSRSLYENFVETYKKTVLAKLTDTSTRIDNVAYLGAGLLVTKLKTEEDSFTNFIPPKKAQEYSQKVYGYENDIGITQGKRTDEGYLIQYVQKRSDAYKKGIRVNDLILKINDEAVTTLPDEKIKMSLYPPIGTAVRLEILPFVTKAVATYEVLCEEYFKETVKNIPTSTDGVYCLRIQSFNRHTADDIKDYIREFEKGTIKLLIIDLMDNPGGPPLAVYELSGIFMPPQTKLFYYKKKDAPESGLTAPVSDIRYEGPMVILINKKSGSASEILAGTFKAYHRALVAGKEPTAGHAFLKSTFNFDDGSMLAMVTGIAYMFNGVKFGMEGIAPDYQISDDITDVLGYIVTQFTAGKLFEDTQEHVQPL